MILLDIMLHWGRHDITPYYGHVTYLVDCAPLFAS